METCGSGKKYRKSIDAAGINCAKIPRIRKIDLKNVYTTVEPRGKKRGFAVSRFFSIYSTITGARKIVR